MRYTLADLLWSTYHYIIESRGVGHKFSIAQQNNDSQPPPPFSIAGLLGQRFRCQTSPPKVQYTEEAGVRDVRGWLSADCHMIADAQLLSCLSAPPFLT